MQAYSEPAEFEPVDLDARKIFGYEFVYEYVLADVPAGEQVNKGSLEYERTVRVRNTMGRTVYVHDRSGVVQTLEPKYDSRDFLRDEMVYVYVIYKGIGSVFDTIYQNYRHQKSIGVEVTVEMDYFEKEKEAHAQIIGQRQNTAMRVVQFRYEISSKSIDECGGCLYHNQSDFVFSTKHESVTHLSHPATRQTDLKAFRNIVFGERNAQKSGFCFHILHVRHTTSAGRKINWYVYNGQVRRLDSVVNNTMHPGVYVMETPILKGPSDPQLAQYTHYPTIEDLPAHLKMYGSEHEAEEIMVNTEGEKASMRLEALRLEREKNEKTHQMYLDKLELKSKEDALERESTKEKERIKEEREESRFQREERRLAREEELLKIRTDMDKDKERMEAASSQRKDTSDLIKYAVFLATNVFTIGMVVYKALHSTK